MPSRTDRLPKAVLAGLASMRTRAHSDCPDVSPQQRAAAELGKLVRKLRWIGMADDATRLERLLAGTATAGAVLH